jgi:LuxR family maltose regulon positive regulatory protein
MMTLPTSSLLATKLFVVRPRESNIERPRLMRLLDRIPDRRLTMISATAGFGKTTLIGSWIERNGISAAWLSLDAEDNNPAQFIAYLIAALRNVEPSIGSAVELSLQSTPLPSMTSLLTPLINELAKLTGQHLLVLEDYHLIENDAIHEGIQFLLEHLPSSIRLVIATRVDPPIPLSRLRVGGELLEIRAADLQFTRQEVGEFLKERMGLDLTPEQVEALHQRTEGWPAGVQMAALSLHGSDDINRRIESFTGLDRFVLDFLLEEVLSTLPPERQRLMLELSILRRFNGPLCEALSGCANGMEMLEELERANLFLIPLDNRREWYRYHQLFSDLLQHRLRLEAPERMAELHRRASLWFNEYGLLAEAFDHARACGDFDLLKSILEKNWRAVLGMGSAAHTYMASIPDEVIESSPLLMLIQGSHLCAIGRILDAARLADIAEPLITEMYDDADQREILGQFAVVRSLVAINTGDPASAISQSERALELVADYPFGSPQYLWQSSHLMINSVMAIGYELRGELARAEMLYSSIGRRARATGIRHGLLTSLVNESRVTLTMGKYTRSAELAREILAIIDEGLMVLEPDAQSITHQMLATYYDERYDVEKALWHTEAAIAATPLYMADRLIELHKIWLDLYILQQRIDDAQQVLVRMEGLSIAGRDPRLARTVRLARAKLLLARGDIEGARTECLSNDAGEPVTVEKMAPVEIFMYARILLASGDGAKAAELIGRVRDKVTAMTTAFVPRFYTTVLHAAALGSAGRFSEALDSLAEAIIMAAPVEFLRPFAADAKYIAPLLARLLHERPTLGVPRSFIESLCRACGIEATGVRVEERQVHVAHRDLSELTSREMEILHLMSLGYTNKKIADKLYVSINTVKTHASNLFDKLGASNRVDALVKAREVGALE